MIAFPRDPEPEEEPAGGLGGGSIRAGRGSRDTRLLERALREQWAIPDDMREAIVRRQVEIATDPACSPRESTSAARCLVSMQQQNQEAALKLLDKAVPDQHEVSHTIEEARAVVAETRRDAVYVALERKRLAADGAHAGLNGRNGKHGPLANGSPPGVD